MEVKIEKIDSGIEEIIIRCRKITPAIESIKRIFESPQVKLIGKNHGESCILKPEEIYYFESVDDIVFAGKAVWKMGIQDADILLVRSSLSAPYSKPVFI